MISLVASKWREQEGQQVSGQDNEFSEHTACEMPTDIQVELWREVNIGHADLGAVFKEVTRCYWYSILPWITAASPAILAFHTFSN